MEFRRITNLPPYVFTIIDGLKVAARRAGEDVIDLGFGNPDLPSPTTAVDKLCEAVRNPRNHRYSASRGIPKLRAAIAERYTARGLPTEPDQVVVELTAPGLTGRGVDDLEPHRAHDVHPVVVDDVDACFVAAE